MIVHGTDTGDCAIDFTNMFPLLLREIKEEYKGMRGI